MWEMESTSVPYKEGIPLYHRSGDTPLDPTTLLGRDGLFYMKFPESPLPKLQVTGCTSNCPHLEAPTRVMEDTLCLWAQLAAAFPFHLLGPAVARLLKPWRTRADWP